MNPELAIREHLASYIDGSIDLESFEDWLVQHTWGIGAAEDLEGVRRLVGGVELAIAEYTAGAVSEDELQDHLGRELLASYRVKLGDDEDGGGGIWLADDAGTVEVMTTT